MSNEIRSIEGHQVSYRYYGNTELTYGHGGVVVIASHHDKVGHRILCGVCAVPNHLNVANTNDLNAQVLVPHRYDRNAARAIADARLHFALFGTWSEKLDERVKEHARWSISRRLLTKEEVAENVTKRRTYLESITKVDGSHLSSDVIEVSIAKCQRHLEHQMIEDAVDPKNLHREESAITVSYDPSEYDGNLTAFDIDEIIVEAVDHACSVGKLPSWVVRVIGEDLAEYAFDCEVDEHFNDGVIRVVSGEDSSGDRSYSFAHVLFSEENENVVVGFTAVGPSFSSVEELHNYASELSAAAERVLEGDEGIVREEAVSDPEDVVYDYIYDDDLDEEDDEAEEDKDEDTDGEDTDGEGTDNNSDGEGEGEEQSEDVNELNDPN